MPNTTNNNTNTKPVHTFAAHDRPVNKICELFDGTLVTVGAAPRCSSYEEGQGVQLRFWSDELDCEFSEAVPRHDRDGKRTTSITCWEALPDGAIVAGCKDGSIRIYTTSLLGCMSAKRQWCCNTVLLGPVDEKFHSEIYYRVRCIAVSEDGQSIAVGYEKSGDIYIFSRLGFLGWWNTRTLRGHTRGITGLVTLPDGRLVSGSEDGTIRWWKDGEQEQCVPCDNGNEIRSLRYLPGKKSLLVKSSAPETVHNFRAGPLHQFKLMKQQQRHLGSTSPPEYDLEETEDEHVEYGFNCRRDWLKSLDHWGEEPREKYSLVPDEGVTSSQSSISCFKFLSDGTVAVGYKTGHVRIFALRDDNDLKRHEQPGPGRMAESFHVTCSELFQNGVYDSNSVNVSTMVACPGIAKSRGLMVPQFEMQL